MFKMSLVLPCVRDILTASLNLALLAPFLATDQQNYKQGQVDTSRERLHAFLNKNIWENKSMESLQTDQCRQCSSRKTSSQSLMIMGDKSFGQLGPPPTQPRTSKFQPKGDKIGLGTRVQKARSDKAEDFVLANLELMHRHDVFQRGDDVKAGDVILAARPFVFCLATSCRSLRCDCCLQRLSAVNKVCCSCGYAYYCSTKCREIDLDIHADECLYIKRKKITPASDTARFLMRLILRLRNGGENEADLVPNKEQPRRFRDLLDHYDDIVNSPRIDMVNSYYNEILRMLGVEEAPDPDYFLECYGRMAINTFTILDESHEAVGIGLYLGPSIMDHSCTPNAAVSFDGVNIVVRSLVDRTSLDFSSVRISYISLLDYTEHRQDHLRRHYYFQCRCDRCLDADGFERSMFCVHCHGCARGEIFVGGKAFSSPEACRDCGSSIGEHSLEKYAETCEIVADKLNAVQVPIETAGFCFKLMTQSRFTTFHILFLKVTEIAFDNYLVAIEKLSVDEDNDELLEAALFHGLNLLAGYARYSQHCWSHEGLYLLKVAEIEFVLGNNSDCERHLRKSEGILRTSMGSTGAKQHLTRILQLLTMLEST